MIFECFLLKKPTKNLRLTVLSWGQTASNLKSESSLLQDEKKVYLSCFLAERTCSVVMMLFIIAYSTKAAEECMLIFLAMFLR